jgi:hypothetical protein
VAITQKAPLNGYGFLFCRTWLRGKIITLLLELLSDGNAVHQ